MIAWTTDRKGTDGRFLLRPQDDLGGSLPARAGAWLRNRQQVSDLLDLAELQEDRLRHLLQVKRGNDTPEGRHAATDFALKIPQGVVAAGPKCGQRSHADVSVLWNAPGLVWRKVGSSEGGRIHDPVGGWSNVALASMPYTFASGITID
jgi:hypothetical protein